MKIERSTMAQDKRQTLIFETARLANFLSNNQLVQANAIVSKMESITREIVAPCAPQIEKSVYWSFFRAILRIKSYILAGKTEDASRDSRELMRMIPQ